MSEAGAERDLTPEPADQSRERFHYPTNHVLAVVDAAEQAKSAVRKLVRSGFLESEVELVCGQEAAEALSATTGRTGLASLAIRLAEKIGASDVEMEVKKLYETALREGRFVVVVLTPTEERKNVAAQTLRACGAHSINFLGRFAIEVLHR